MKYFVVDAFTDKLFKGNPAGVCLLDQQIDEVMMQNIAAENNLSETAFVLKTSGGYYLRWFTPEEEVDLCGHATLASAYVIRNSIERGANKFVFFTKSGELTVGYKEDLDLYELDFPARPAVMIENIPEFSEAAGCEILEAYLSRDLVLLAKDEASVKSLIPDIEKMNNFEGCFGIVVTALGDTSDFVSRFFIPRSVIPEDPVTGSSHCTLIPLWAKRLGKESLVARQLSGRGGTLYCKNEGGRVKIAGHAILYMLGAINL